MDPCNPDFIAFQDQQYSRRDNGEKKVDIVFNTKGIELTSRNENTEK